MPDVPLADIALTDEADRGLVARASTGEREALEELVRRREHPFYEAPDVVPALRRLIESPEFRQATDPA